MVLSAAHSRSRMCVQVTPVGTEGEFEDIDFQNVDELVQIGLIVIMQTIAYLRLILQVQSRFGSPCLRQDRQRRCFIFREHCAVELVRNRGRLFGHLWPQCPVRGQSVFLLSRLHIQDSTKIIIFTISISNTQQARSKAAVLPRHILSHPKSFLQQINLRVTSH